MKKTCLNPAKIGQPDKVYNLNLLINNMASIKQTNSVRGQNPTGNQQQSNMEPEEFQSIFGGVKPTPRFGDKTRIDLDQYAGQSTERMAAGSLVSEPRLDLSNSRYGDELNQLIQSFRIRRPSYDSNDVTMN